MLTAFIGYFTKYDIDLNKVIRMTTDVNDAMVGKVKDL